MEKTEEKGFNYWLNQDEFKSANRWLFYTVLAFFPITLLIAGLFGSDLTGWFISWLKMILIIFAILDVIAIIASFMSWLDIKHD